MAAVAAETDGELLFGQVVGVQPGLTTTAPEVVQVIVTEQPGANAGTRGTIESLGRWNEKEHDRAMPLKFEAVHMNDRDGTRDLAGKWCACFWVHCWGHCTTKKALNEDQYAESGRCCVCCVLPGIPISETRSTRKYVHGQPTNGFDGYDFNGQPVTHWHRDPGCAAGSAAASAQFLFAKKAG